ncbi:MAG: hypothetical protein WKG06_26660 [Segetibacter sp.]
MVESCCCCIDSGYRWSFDLFIGYKKSIEKDVAQQMAPAEAAEMTPKTDSIGPVEKPLAQVQVLPKKELFNKRRTASPIIQEEKRRQ